MKQARTYDIVPDAASGFVPKARVLGPSDLSNVAIPDLITTLVQDPLDVLAPFAGTKRSIGFSGRDIDALDRALAQSGFFQPAPAGLYLRSEDFFGSGWPASAVGSDRHPGKSAPRTYAVRHLRSVEYRRQVPPFHAYRRH